MSISRALWRWERHDPATGELVELAYHVDGEHPSLPRPDEPAWSAKPTGYVVMPDETLVADQSPRPPDVVDTDEQGQTWERCHGCRRQYLAPHCCRTHGLCGVCHPPMTERPR